jgi:hypothetical protein
MSVTLGWIESFGISLSHPIAVDFRPIDRPTDLKAYRIQSTPTKLCYEICSDEQRIC